MPRTSLLRWSAYEHEHIERGQDWYWALATAAVAIALTSLIFHDILFGLLILMAAVVIALLSRKPPDIVDFELSHRGIRVGDTMHKFEEIISFWVEDHDVPRPLLLVDTTKFLAPNLIIPIEHVDPQVVR